MSSAFRRRLEGPLAPAITHLSLVLLTALLFTLLLAVPLWIALIPGVMIAHRIGILLHEYFHGIPFRRYRNNLAVLSGFDGLLLLFGLLELIRGLHLAHHHWLNSDLDPANEQVMRFKWKRLNDLSLVHTTMQSATWLTRAIRGQKPYVKRSRIVLGIGLSLAAMGAWRLLGHPEMIWKTLVISLVTLVVPVSIRGAIEHYSFHGDPHFANEYKVVIPMFNANRHVHHHLEPTVPWYLLEFTSTTPLPVGSYFAHWFHAFVKHDFVLMQPPDGEGRRSADGPRRSDLA
jgi:fatty acid desaturase